MMQDWNKVKLKFMRHVMKYNWIKPKLNLWVDFWSMTQTRWNLRDNYAAWMKKGQNETYKRTPEAWVKHD
jgi:hypothetical protein